MPTNVLMPKWGMSMQEGTITSWLKQQGDTVAEGEELVEIESDKAIDVVTAPASGLLARILVAEGEAAPITTVIAVIASQGEELGDVVAAVEQQVEAETARKTGTDTAAAVARKTSSSKRSGRRVPASPAARRLARKFDIDLDRIEGTGPDGMIVADDVESAQRAGGLSPLLGSRSSPPESRAAGHVEPEAASPSISRLAPGARRSVGFYSGGHKLDGRLYLPRDLPADARAPAVVFCLGFTYVKELLVPEMARRLCADGFACLLFDYRGFGKSEGPRGHLFPTEQVADIRAAVTFLAAQPQVDSRRIALAGISLGGSHALYCAAVDARVHSTVAIAPIGDGRRWLRGNRPYWQWRAFLEQLERDRTTRALSGEGTHVDAWEIVAPDPASLSFLDDLLGEFPALRCELSLESAEALVEYCPERMVERIAPRPVLLIQGDNDLVVPLDESRSLLDRCGENCRLITMPDMGHFDWGLPGDKRFDQVMQAVAAWLGTQTTRGADS